MDQSVLLHHQKFYIAHRSDREKQALVELKVWQKALADNGEIKREVVAAVCQVQP